MALADILQRIDRDADAEANAVVLAAEAHAERLRHEAQAESVAHREHEIARAEREAADDARTRLAGARLRGRDRVLAEKRALIERAIGSAEASIVALPDDRYVALMVREISASARGGEKISLGEADAARLGGLQEALAAADVNAAVVGATSAVKHGVVLEGDRMRVEVSPAALIESRRGELEAHIMETLFGGDGDS